MSSAEFVPVTKKEFFDYVNPRDICLESQEKETLWYPRSEGWRHPIGKSAGYTIPMDENFYMLRKDLVK